ncbi:response regulator [Kovacikia minuta CCNUW1]|uniref:ATP-binding protein n=1 Tax=Kovacikia minuta TaxID=2931930 RepID=UPI001CCB093A|nr:ATP-binding protein [Kovacikia minuta]UBF25484.1 response regulator [Kovacikia minuta CCNUW1]
MAFHNTCLREFVELVPDCPETASLIEVLEVLCQGNREINDSSVCSPEAFYQHLILVNARHQPFGLVSLHRLMPYLTAAGLIGSLSVTGCSSVDGAISPEMPLCSIAPNLIESVTVLSGDLPISQFIPFLEAEIPSHCVLIDDEKILGLLDTSRLLQALAMNLFGSEELPLPPTSQPIEPSEPNRQKALKRQQRQNVRLVQQLLAQKAEMEMQLGSQQQTINRLIATQEAVQAIGMVVSSDAAAAKTPPTAIADEYFHPLLLNPLLGLLERLPLPLMLQTSSGRVLGQNSIWCEQVGELLDPDWIRQEAAVFLETATEAEINSSLSPSLCHLGSKPGSCICVCPLKNGQEQVLQFLKIPLGKLSIKTGTEDGASAATNLDTRLHWQSLSTLEESPNFRLATLIPREEASGSQFTTGEITQGERVGETHSGLTVTATPPAVETLWLVLAQDLTEQQQLARELTAKNADLIQLNRLKDEFLACISHELRTPLTAVLGLSSLLKDQTIGEMNQRQMHYAQLIYQSGRHLMAVVNDILDLARMETGQLELVAEPVDIPTVCDRAWNQAKQLRLLDDQQGETDEGSGIPQYKLEIEPGLDLLVADEQRLRQMLVHLLSNALKFTEIDRQIGLKVNRWGGWIAFTIWDQGIGIPSDKQHLIFQKFQQLENPLTRRFEGTGLGLVLTQRFARLHGGDVTFLSKEGEGSQFTILLPPEPPEKPLVTNRDERSPSTEYLGVQVPINPSSPASCPSPQVRLSLANHDQRLVLVVEVVPQFIETLSERLTGFGYRVVIARSGTEALEKARRLQPGIIFLNPVLPLLSGWDVLTLLKANLETRQIPVIVTTTKVDEAHTHRSHADGWLSLPVQPKALQQILHQHLQELKEPESRSSSAAALTVLRLNPENWTSRDPTLSTLNLNHLLHSHHYRVLESDDLDQAELLARVWKPNVVLLDGALNNPTAYFQQHSQHAFLASLPLVTLSQEATQAANQVPGLLVFPCLAVPAATSDGDMKTSALLQVIQVAAGYAWRPSVLALDVTALSNPRDTAEYLSPSQEAFGSFPKESEWLQALTQYLQTAHLRGLMGRSWQEVLQQVQSRSVDLLLIGWTEPVPRSTTLQMLTTLSQLQNIPPVLVLDHRNSGVTAPSPSQGALPAVLQQLATQVLPSSLSMAELLEQIQHFLVKS